MKCNELLAFKDWQQQKDKNMSKGRKEENIFCSNSKIDWNKTYNWNKSKTEKNDIKVVNCKEDEMLEN